MKDLKEKNPYIAAVLGIKPIELVVIQKELPDYVAILQYLPLPDKLIIFVVRNRGVDIVEKGVTKAEIEYKVDSLRKAILDRAVGILSQEIQPLSRELYDVLIKPVEENEGLKGVNVIGVAPNSFLHQLPFGTLMNAEGRYSVGYDAVQLDSATVALHFAPGGLSG